jgi:hypothetical protein
MTIVQPKHDATGLFEIVLPARATAEQTTLKEKIDEVISVISKKKGDANYPEWLKQLQEIATNGFDAPNADPDAARKSLEVFEKSVTRPEPPVGETTRPGGYTVKLPDPENPRDKEVGWQQLVFEPRKGVVVPPVQLKLKADIEMTLTVLQNLLPDENAEPGPPKNMTAMQHRYRAYQTELLGAAQVGLMQTPPDPDASRQALESLQMEVLVREGPRVKNGYMKVLGVSATVSGALAAIIYLMLRNNPHFSQLLYAYQNLFVLWTGTMIGTWLSFGLRRPKLAFKDLGALEDDMVEPGIRLIFTGLIAIIIAFIFGSGMVNVSIGGLNSANLLAHGSSALLIGMLLGVSEQALPGMLTKRASQFVSEIGVKG